MSLQINVRENRRGNQNGQSIETDNKTKTNKAKAQPHMCWIPLQEANANKVNNTRAFLQTTAGKDEPNIIFMRKS